MALQFNALIVDDTEEVIDVIEMYLEKMGCFKSIMKSKDGIDAGMKLRNQLFHVVFLDINLPKKNGIDIAHFLKESEKTMQITPLSSVIIISGELDKSVLQDALTIGVKNFVVKPFNEEQIQAKTLQVLKKLGAK